MVLSFSLSPPRLSTSTFLLLIGTGTILKVLLTDLQEAGIPVTCKIAFCTLSWGYVCVMCVTNTRISGAEPCVVCKVEWDDQLHRVQPAPVSQVFCHCMYLSVTV